MSLVAYIAQANPSFLETCLFVDLSYVISSEV
jgi:hypothetical protein